MKNGTRLSWIVSILVWYFPPKKGNQSCLPVLFGTPREAPINFARLRVEGEHVSAKTQRYHPAKPLLLLVSTNYANH